MEIPTVKLELYQENPELFAQELGQALETVGVAQVDGLEQGLVDGVYHHAGAVFKEYSRKYHQANEYKNHKGMERHELLFDPRFISGKRFQRFSQFYFMAGKLRVNLDGIYETIKDALQIHLRHRLCQVRAKELYLFQYYGSTEEREMYVGPHEDGQIMVLAPRATGEGLEVFICREQKEPWQKLEPNAGHALIFPGRSLKKQSNERILALSHRVRRIIKKSPRTALVYGA